MPICLIKIRNHGWDFFMCFQEHGQATDLALYKQEKCFKKIYYKKNILKQLSIQMLKKDKELINLLICI